MNKHYSLVWNRSRKQVEVASEFAGSRGSAGTHAAARTTRARQVHVAQLALAVMFAFGAVPAAMAGTDCAASSATATGTNAVACGPNAKAIGVGAAAYGSNASAGVHGTALGLNSSASSDATAVGEGATAGGTASTALGDHATTTGSGALAAGYGANAAQAGAALGDHATAGVNGAAVGVQAQAGSDAAAVGERSNAKGTNSAAFGYQANAYSNRTVAIGVNATAGNSASSLSSMDSVAMGTSATASKTDAIAIGHGANASFTGSVALGAGSVTAAAHPTASVLIRGDTYTFAGANPSSVVSVGASGQERQVTHVAAGQLNANSTDAVNGSQLYATNQALEAVTGTASAGWNLAANGGAGVNIAPSATVDVAQGNNIVVTQDAGTGDLTIATSDNPGFTTLATTGEGTIGGMLHANGGLAVASGTGADMGGNQVGNVAAGQLNATSTDAVNGSQLYATNQAVTTLGTQVNTNTGDIGNLQTQVDNTNQAVTTLGTQVNTNTGDIGNLQNQVDNTNQAVTALGAQVNTNTGDIGNLQTQVDSIAQGHSGQFQVSADSTGSPTPTGANSVAGGADANASGDNGVALGNGSSASGDRSTAVGTASAASGAGSTALGEGASASGANSVALGAGSVAATDDTVSVGSSGHERKVSNVAEGTASTDAVNVGQLQSAQAADVHYDGNADGSIDYNNVTLDSNGQGPATLRGVAAGTATTDAVNVGQLNSGLATTQNWAAAYADRKFNQLQANLGEVGRRADAGIAAAIAAANIPQPYAPGQSALGVGVGTFHGQTGIAVGLSRITSDGRFVLKANASSTSNGYFSAGVGAAVVW